MFIQYDRVMLSYGICVRCVMCVRCDICGVCGVCGVVYGI